MEPAVCLSVRLRRSPGLTLWELRREGRKGQGPHEREGGVQGGQPGRLCPRQLRAFLPFFPPRVGAGARRRGVVGGGRDSKGREREGRGKGEGGEGRAVLPGVR